MEHYEQALTLNPSYPEAHTNLANVLVSLGRPEEAIAHYQQALRLKPDFIEAHFNLALACAKAGQADEAIAAAQKAAESAKSQNQPALARQIENWLNSYREMRSK